MKRRMFYMALTMLYFLLLAMDAFAKSVIPVGEVVGLELQDSSVTVAAFDSENGSTAKAAGLAVGDRIAAIDGHPIATAEDIRNALVKSDGTVSVTVLRGNAEKTFRISPHITEDGPKLGVYLRQGITGIGTVTWYDPDTGTFGTLGHGVNNSSGRLLTLTRGYAYAARVMSVRKGISGDPGQLMGAIESRTPIGTLQSNTPQGVFGTSQTGWEGQLVECASADEIKTGSAVIRSTVAGTEVREYSVEILKIYPKSRQNGRNLLLRITDPALLEATGGIVQGMGVSYNKDNQWNP